MEKKYAQFYKCALQVNPYNYISYRGTNHTQTEGVLTAKRGFYTLRICRISCRLRKRFKLPNAVVTEQYEILHTAEGTEGWQTLGMNGFLGFDYC
ncbi:hypothetical protein BACCIP111899_03891 [Bacillus rhizoplanae]|uniref:Uncharacterized protein n=1 Tax=Bacillus rhizoplanae TaxID=2880966 RepID=A0ABM8YG17_9BACI|nr:hypothetical protein [Bacillus rhizoplanae]CAG9614658.1 hypothetical protein BACCIP111899_03891 [Bacillus rhizoplanae]